MDRVEQFLGDRLHGRPVPPDLRRLVELQLDGVLADDERFQEVRLLDPDELHPLQQPPVSHPWAPVTDPVLAACRASDEVLSHVGVVVDAYDGALFGYWLHPDEPSDPNPPIVMLDTEGRFELVSGTTLTDALGIEPEFCAEYGVPVVEGGRRRQPSPTVDPAVLFDTLYEREVRFRRPLAVGTDDTAPIGIACDDPRVVATLAGHGFPPDLKPLIAAADVGKGEVTLSAPACAASVELRQENAQTWYVHLMAFRRPADDRPPCTQLPFGFVLDETRAQVRARFGEPDWQGARSTVESWRFGPLDLHVAYDADDTPLVVRVFPADLVATFRYTG